MERPVNSPRTGTPSDDATAVDPYRLERVLGHGASGWVYASRHGDRPVAVKRCTPQYRAAAAQEAATLAGIWFPGVVQLLDATVDPVDGSFLAVFELIEGPDILAATEHLELSAIAKLFADVLRALAFVHRRGLVHRDLKPQNLLVSERGGVKCATLIDFGLARPPRTAGAVGGTLAYLAPEVLAGEPAQVRSDLYSLGIVLYQCLARTLPSVGLQGVEVLRLHGQDVRLPDDSARTLPPELVDLVHSLLRRDPTLRPGSADEVLDSLARAVGEPLPLETTQTIEGRIRSLEFPLPARLREQIRDHGLGRGALAVTLPPGSEVWLRKLRIEWAAANRTVCLLRLGAGDPAPEVVAGRPPASVVLVHCVGVLDERDEALVRDLVDAAAATQDSAVIVAIEDDLPLPACLADSALPRLELPRPDREEVERVVKEALGVDLGEVELSRLRVLSDYSALSVRDGLGAMLRAGILVEESGQPQWNRSARRIQTAAPTNRTRARRAVVGLSDPERSVLRLLSLARIPIAAAIVEGWHLHGGTERLDGVLGDLLAKGLVQPDERTGRIALASAALAEEVRSGFDGEARREWTARLGRAVRSEGADDPERLAEAGWLLSAAGEHREASEAIVEAGRRLRRAGRTREARAYLEPCLETSADPIDRARVLRWIADCVSLEGQNDAALALIEQAVRLDADPEDLGACFAIAARSHDRNGNASAAAEAIERGLAVAGISGTTRALLLTTRSMLLRNQSRMEAAREAAEEALLAAGPAPSLERGAALMTFANASAYLGRIEAAVDAYRAAEELGHVLDRPDMSAMAVANLGRLLLENGRFRETVETLQPLLDRLERGGDLRHGENVLQQLILAKTGLGDIVACRQLGLKGRSFFGRHSSRQNHALFLAAVAAAELRAGNLNEAERLIRESIEIRAEVGSAAVQAFAWIELARIESWAGRADAARRTLVRASRQARRSGQVDVCVNASVVLADLRLEGRRFAAARRAAQRAWDASTRIESPLLLAMSAVRLARACFGTGDPAEASRVADEALERVSSVEGVSIPLLRALRARCRRFDDEGAESEFGSALKSLSVEGHAAERATVVRWRSEWRLRGLEPDGDAKRADVRRAVVRLSGVRSDLEECRAIAGSLSLSLGATRVDELARELDEVESRFRSESKPSSGIARHVTSMERLLEVNKALNSELDPRRLLNLILDEAITLCGARRGFLILVKGVKMEVRVARNFAEQDIQHPEFQFSRSVARRVALSGEAVKASNALHDPLFRSIDSIAQLKITSILCVPLRARDQLLGSIYLDHPDVVDRFDDVDLEHLTDFAAAAGIALERAQLYQENMERAEALASAKQEIERLNAALVKQVEEQARELDATKDTLMAERRAAARRYDYHNIVTQSASMQDVLKLLDRITETELPVLIQGESGTGKELVARAVHYNGPRAHQNFVSVNCAAMAEPLIEAELFGYVKGAFTGADRDRKGLFEVADQGTLFLDEIGDMSLEVQKRLLRVVQYGEFHRVGGKETVRVNVRIISATHRDLRKLIQEGQFREDLYYRLNVAPVTLPPLRERVGDVPLLIRHFTAELERSGLSADRRYSRDAMAALERHTWPGNVREVQNEVKRLLLLPSDRSSIEFEDLPEVIRGHGVTGAPPASRPLKEAVEQYEREIVRTTLDAVGGNKSEAARRLGVSVRGLYKILERIGLADVPGAGRRPNRGA